MKAPDKEWYDIVFQYWSQITVLIGIIGFCAGKFIELNNKKSEIRFSKLHENKILEIKLFYKSYQSARIALKRFYEQTMFGEHTQEILNNLSQEINEKLIEFEYNSMTIKLFIDNKDLMTIDEILKTLSTIRTDLLIWHINARPNNSTNLPDNLEKIGFTLNKTLPDLIKNIEGSLRNNFN
jgi:hypothetical protein